MGYNRQPEGATGLVATANPERFGKCLSGQGYGKSAICDCPIGYGMRTGTSTLQLAEPPLCGSSVVVAYNTRTSARCASYVPIELSPLTRLCFFEQKNKRTKV